MKIIGYPCKRHKRGLKDSRVELPELLPPAPHKNEVKRSKEREKQAIVFIVHMNALRDKISKLTSDQCDPVNCHSYPTLTFGLARLPKPQSVGPKERRFRFQLVLTIG